MRGLPVALYRVRGLHVSLVFLPASVCCDTAQTKAERVPAGFLFYFVLAWTM